MTCKAHILFEHLSEELERTGFGTALWNESAGEAIHADFDKFFQSYIVKDINSTAYTKKLFHAVKLHNVGYI